MNRISISEIQLLTDVMFSSSFIFILLYSHFIVVSFYTFKKNLSIVFKLIFTFVNKIKTNPY